MNENGLLSLVASASSNGVRVLPASAENNADLDPLVCLSTTSFAADEVARGKDAGDLLTGISLWE